MQVEHITYGEGGYDPAKPDSNIVEREWIEVPDEPEADTAKVVGKVRAELAQANTVKAMKDAIAPLLDHLESAQ